MAIVGRAVVLVFLMVLSTIFNGYALSILWGWFVVPTFGSPQLSIPAAIGVSMVVSYLTHQINMDSDDEKQKPFDERLIAATALAIVKPSLALLFGWIVSAWM